jgi:DNA-binding transcriptional ArsR family regulator
MAATSTLTDEWHDLPDFSLGERDIDVLAVLREEDLATFSFEGLKRRLGLHPETLSRILLRLEQEGFVEKKIDGYGVTSRINEFLRTNPNYNGDSRVTLLKTFLPSDIPVARLVSDLRGRWFGFLRWLGLSDDGGSVTLKWITEDGGIQVEAHISETALTIEAKFLQEKNMNTALKACYQLLNHISQLCSPLRRVQNVSYCSGSNAFLTSA